MKKQITQRERELLSVIWGILNASTLPIEHETAIKYMAKIERKEIGHMELWSLASETKDGTLIGLLEMI